MILHVACHATDGTLLIRDWSEASALWTRLSAATHPVALAIMLNHLHALIDASELERLRSACRSYALWRNSRRGESGAVWRSLPRGVPVEESRHFSRTHRYILLNPCREELVEDPLAWPFTTLRDALGLAWPSARPAVPDPERFHRWVSSDASTQPGGTPFPQGPAPEIRARSPVESVLSAVSALTRTVLPQLRRRGPVRTLLVRCCTRFTSLPATRIAARLGVSPLTVRRSRDQASHPAEELVAKVLEDPRFAALRQRHQPWRRLAGRAPRSPA